MAEGSSKVLCGGGRFRLEFGHERKRRAETKAQQGGSCFYLRREMEDGIGNEKRRLRLPSVAAGWGQ